MTIDALMYREYFQDKNVGENISIDNAFQFLCHLLELTTT